MISREIQIWKKSGKLQQTQFLHFPFFQLFIKTHNSCLRSSYCIIICLALGSGICSGAIALVASNLIRGGNPALNASYQRPAHNAQRSPGFNPGKEPRGVDKSLPCRLVKSKNWKWSWALEQSQQKYQKNYLHFWSWYHKPHALQDHTDHKCSNHLWTILSMVRLNIFVTWCLRHWVDLRVEL